MVLNTPLVLIIFSLDRLLEYMGSSSYIPVLSPHTEICRPDKITSYYFIFYVTTNSKSRNLLCLNYSVTTTRKLYIFLMLPHGMPTARTYFSRNMTSRYVSVSNFSKFLELQFHRRLSLAP